MRDYDSITHINGEPVASFDDLMVHVGSSLAGSANSVTRLGDTLDLEVTLAKYYNDRPYIASVRPEPTFGLLRVDYASTRTVPVPGERWARPEMDRPRGGVGPRRGSRFAASKFETLGEARTVDGDPRQRPLQSPGEFYKAARDSTRSGSRCSIRALPTANTS